MTENRKKQAILAGPLLLAGQADALAGDISGFIVSMLFQDITRQRIEYVVEPLPKLKAESGQILAKLREASVAIAGHHHKADAACIEEPYAMESELAVKN